MPAPQESPKKKKIIITDWSVRYGVSPENIPYQLTLWSWLLQQGFELQVWTGKTLVMADSTQALFDALQQVEPIHEKNLIPALALQGLSRDDCFIANLSAVLHLLEKSSTVLSIKPMLSFNLPALSTLPDPLIKSLLDSFSDQEDIDITFQHIQAMLDNPLYLNFIKRHPSLNIIEKIDSDAFALLLNQVPRLERLKITLLESVADTIPLPESVTSLNLAGTHLTFKQIATLIGNNRQLTTLTLSNCKKLGDPAGFQLPESLRSFDLAFSDLTFKQIATLIRNNRQLTILNLSGCEALGDSADFQLPESVTVLNLSGTNLTLKQIATLIGNNRQLTILNLSVCEDLGELADFQLPESVTVLDLMNTYLTFQQIATLIGNNRQLTTLKLSVCEALGDPADFQLPESVTALDLFGTNLTFTQIATLIGNNRQLTILNLSYCKNLGDLAGFHLPESVTVLDLGCTNLTLKQIATLIGNNRQLTILNLSVCEDLGELADFQLPESVTALDLSFTHLTFKQINILIEHCHLLETLNLSYCKNLGDLAGFHLPESVTVLDLGCTNLTYDPLFRLISACSHLKKIQLSGCSGVTPAELLQLEERFPNIKFNFDRAETYADQHRVSIPLDSNTRGHNQPIPTRQLFKAHHPDQDPHPSQYRLKFHDKIILSRNRVELSSTLVREEDTHVFPDNRNGDARQLFDETRNPNDYLGQITIPAGRSGWIALPSLSSIEEIRAVQTFPAIKYQLGYNKKEQRHYIKFDKPLSKPTPIAWVVNANVSQFSAAVYQGHVTLSRKQIALLKTLEFLEFNEKGMLVDNPASRWLKKLPVEECTQILFTFFNDVFEPKPLQGNPPAGIATLNSILAQAYGTCRHRTQALMALAQALNIEARAIFNDCHAYVEVKQKNTWLRADLGGAPGSLNIEKMPALPVSKPLKIPIETPVKIPIETPEVALSPDNVFRTWDTAPSQAVAMDAYLQELLTHAAEEDHKNPRVLSRLAANQIEPLHRVLCQSKKKFHYLHDLDEVRNTQIIINNETHDYREKDSRLVKFLNEAQPGDVLMVNWSHYESRHVGYNTLMEDHRSLNGVPIPDGVIVVGLLEHEQSMGEDFYSRYPVKSLCPPTLQAEMPPPPTESGKNDCIITFYDDDWQSVLLGKFRITPEGYSIENSPLLEAIQAGKNVILNHAPWHLPAFRLFITEMLERRVIDINGKPYSVPKTFQIFREDRPFDLSQGNFSKPVEAALSDHMHVLNTVTLSLFLAQYHCDDNKQLHETPGIVAQHSDAILPVLLTDTLTDAQWSLLLEATQKNHCTLRLLAAPGVALPYALKDNAHSQPPFSCNTVIVTNDIDVATEEIKKTIIPINEHTTYDDLIDKIELGNNALGKRTFSHRLCDLGKKLGKQPVALKGQLSPLLAKQLESLFLPQPYLCINGEQQHLPPGCLQFITNQQPAFSFLNPTQQQYTEDDFWETLEKQFKKTSLQQLKAACETFYTLAPQAPRFSYIQLKTMMTQLHTHPERNPFKPFLRLHENVAELTAAAKKAWAANKLPKQAQAVSVGEKRLNKILSSLDDTSPYLFVAGASGIGKSTFMQRELTKKGHTVFTGMDQLKAWIERGASPENPCDLFIDEANLSAPGTFDIFEGLFLDPKTILIDGISYPLPSNHHVIFAGNFGHFKGRQQHDFFARHGNVILFKEFPDAFLKDTILQPLLDKLFKDFHPDNINYLKEHFLEAYHHINALFPDQHPVTARNLQNMVLRATCLQRDDKLTDLAEICGIALYDELSTLLSKSQRQDFKQWLDKTLKATDIKAIKKPLKETVGTFFTQDSRFIMTKKRQNPVRLLRQQLAMRDVKINANLLTTGTTGILLEGEAGIGKSLMAESYLNVAGYEKATMASPPPSEGQKRYYHLTPTNYAMAEKIILTAFHEGAIVIIDEMNTMPLEKLLNPLLSGDKKADHPGFFVIATQNPISYGKRQALSPALLNRFQHLPLKDYDKTDLRAITKILMKNKDQKEAERLVDEYLQAKDYAKRHRLAPEPTPRDLLKKARKRGL